MCACVCVSDLHGGIPCNAALRDEPVLEARTDRQTDTLVREFSF